jgi:GNAT superfamily N-acetyltransferase
MGIEYSVQTCRQLEEVFRSQKILRPFRIQRYDPGTELSYEIEGIVPARIGRVKLEVEDFVGGGYAGQVYRVKALDIEAPDGPLEGIKNGQSYAMKIFVPAKGFQKWFRNFIYSFSFQGHFSPQVNPDAVRAGALWQKFIQRGAKLRLGSESAIVNILATFVDPALGSCGEISEWVEGRMWRFEVDDNLDARLKWKVGKSAEGLGSPEYRAKRAFMANLLQLMHEMGAAELARQYEWWTCKSQPNVLKRIASDPDPAQGYVAVDFRAGLALLPFLPMSPADFKLIFKGIGRGSLIQFDRGNIEKLQGFVESNSPAFADMSEALNELKEVDTSYRDSLPDVTHHHLKLFTRPKLWSSILSSNIRGWKIRKLIDEKTQERLKKKKFPAFIFYCLGLIPFVGNFLRKLWGREDYRRHYGRMLTNPDYLLRGIRARIMEYLIRWHRAGRVDEKKAASLSKHPLRVFVHLPLSILPAKMHRFFTDWRFFLKSLAYIFVRPFRLYFNAEAREKWLLDIVSQGEKAGMLTKKEAEHINSQVKEPFIQKYLKSLAVHVCTLPVTQIVSVTIAIIYVRLHPELAWQEASLRAGLILGFFQVIPISPGSLARGLYTTSLVLRERKLKDYNIAFFMSFLKYIGYLAFPIQMAYRYPDLARFMAGHWATGAAHIVPVFGERGALLEHAVFDTFFNYPLSIRRRMRQRKEMRSGLKPRYWHVPLCILSGTLALVIIDLAYFKLLGHIPNFGSVWWLALLIPVFAAAAAASWAGGAILLKRILLGIICGALIGFLYAVSNTFLGNVLAQERSALLSFAQLVGKMGLAALWRAFLFVILAIIGVFIAETRPLKRLQQGHQT